MLQILCLISCILVFIINIICLIKGIKPTSYEDIIKGINNMNAKEMFKELGYEIDSTRETENHLFYVSEYAIIDFDLLRGDFYKYNQSGFRSPIDMKLLKAINKQIEELGWNNE